MSVQFGWYIPERVIYVNFYNRIRMRDYKKLHEGITEMLAVDRTQPIHIIQDESNIKSIEPDVSNVYKDNVIAQGKVKGAIVTIGIHKSHPVMSFISSVLAKIGHSTYKRFRTCEEAEEYLVSIDPTLDFSQAARNHLEMTYTANTQ